MSKKKKTKKPASNPNGREGDRIKIDLSFEEAVEAALKVQPPKSAK